MPSSLFLLRRQRQRDHKKKLRIHHLALFLLFSLSLLAAFFFVSDLPLQTPKSAIFANGSLPSSRFELKFAPEVSPELKDAIFADGSSLFPTSVSPSPQVAILGSGSMPPEIAIVLEDAVFSADGSSSSQEVAILGSGSMPPEFAPELEDAISADGLSPSPEVAILGGESLPDSHFVRLPVSQPAPEVSIELRDASFANGSTPSSRNKPSPVLTAASFKRERSSGGGGGKCDLYSGRWVKDAEGRYPLYSPGKCPFVDPAFACQENGRRDAEYLKWRWKPDGCDLPRFNATDFLERLRGKVMMLVGDSMSRNQFGSLLCLLREALPVKNRMYEKRGYKISRERGYFTVRFPDYNCSVKYQRSYYLVSEGSRLDARGKTWPTLRLDTIDKFALRWKSADILIFNTGHWWNQEKTYSGKNFYQEGSTVYPRLGPAKAYRRALRTWAAWIEKNLTPRENTVFFRGLGTSHFRGGAWYSGGTCNKETEPAFRGRILNVYPWKMKIIEEVVRRMRFPVTFMNVTRLTNFRKDAHPSMYGGIWTVPGTPSVRKEDCSHWCLPGVPDTWNELLYANIVLER